MVAKDQRKWHVTEGTEGIHDAIESHTSNVNEETATVMKTDKSEEQLDMMITREELMKKKKRERRERQKKARASVPCKFFSMEGSCWRGEKCMFLHDKNVLEVESAFDGSETGDTKMDVNCIENIAKKLNSGLQFSLPSRTNFDRRKNKALLPR